ncbi:glycosyltransferase family 8 protein [Limosilactobacillus caecicola]|uniref:glycosyltransferase family 8 protein n=1 Tax=Limosilactobacillus caecicola TaxID=2941332 RepID=UPI00203AA038|nr:glycosyltransferase family 8 protein [Limosilactobacillus caecicola]
MNIMFCGDHNAEDGVLIATLSLLKHCDQLHIYILTMTVETENQHFEPFSATMAEKLQELVNAKNPASQVKLINCDELFHRTLPEVNLSSRFTPYAMLRLFADQIPELPDRLLYLDDDVIVRRNLDEFYQQRLDDVELVGVLDYWGRFFFHNLHTKRLYDYVNSGVLLLNLAMIRQTGSFAQIREMMQTRRMFFPDQSAINRVITKKRIAPRRYNEQYHLQTNTVIQHFTTTFRFTPYLHTLTVKSWEVERVHSVLNLHEYDDVLNQYLKIKQAMSQEVI